MIYGTVESVGDRSEVTTKYGTRAVGSVTLRSEAGDTVSVSLWGDWAETIEYLTAGMELAVIDPERQFTDGEVEYATSGDSYVVVEPEFLVDVTDIREWVQCPRQYYLSKLQPADTSEPLVVGTLVHEVFGDLLRGREAADAISDRVNDAAIDIGILDVDRSTIEEQITDHVTAIEGWLSQQTLASEDTWQSEQLLISDRFGMKGRADAIRRGMPVELKTGKNTRSSPRFHDKIQAACYALMLRERGVDVDTGVLLYTKNATLDRGETSGDLAPAKEFSIKSGLLQFVVRMRNELAAMEHGMDIPTGHEADADCSRCFVQDSCRVVAGRLDQTSKAGAMGHPVPDTDRAYFQACYRAIEHERRAIHDEYRKLWEQSPKERVNADRALIDLTCTDRRQRADGRWELTVKRSDDIVSKFREGDLVLASDGDPINGEAAFGSLMQLTADQVTLIVDDPLPVSRIDMYPSEVSVDRMLAAVHDTVLTGDDRRLDVLMGRQSPAFQPIDETFVSNNASQNRAIAKAVGAQDCALIHGPPGTGKTHTIARLVRALVDRGNRVLISAFTNRAVDNALEALREQGFDDILRVGSVDGIRHDMQDLRLGGEDSPETQHTKLKSTPVVAATAASCGSRTLREQTFDVAIVDEASQLTEPATLAPINLADRFVLVGDHQQLPPVVQTAQTADAAPESPFDGDLSVSLFERLIDQYPSAAVTLDRQYRMSQRIQSFSAREFYDGKLRPATGDIATRSLRDLATIDTDALPVPLRQRVSFHHVPGDDDDRIDLSEAKFIGDLLEGGIAAGLAPEQIGVIAPYRAQVAALERHVPDGVVVDTVDRFQGSSKDVIVLSLVVSESIEGPLFEDHRRINVALTRAKRSLVIVGDCQALQTDPFYTRLYEWAAND